jgi:hypothetical protein
VASVVRDLKDDIAASRDRAKADLDLIRNAAIGRRSKEIEANGLAPLHSTAVNSDGRTHTPQVW